MPEETSALPLETSLGIDLAQSFGPAWARETDSKERLERLARQHGGGEDERPRRGGRSDRSFDRERRPPNRERSGTGGGGAGPKRRDDRRPARPERAEPKWVPELTGWEVKFTPDRHGVEGLAKQIKASGRAYPLFDLARLVLDKSERYVVDFRKADEDAPPLWQVKADGTLWLSEGEAVSHALSAALDQLYVREEQTVEPPKGAVQIVGVCGMSGTLLGPPTHHDYQIRVARLYKERFSHLPFETYKSRIRMERDEALIEKWREQESRRDVFRPRPPTSEPESELPPPEAVPADESAVAPEAEPAIAGEPEALDSAIPSEAGTPPEEISTEEASASEPEVILTSMAEVERHFRANHAPEQIVSIRQKVAVPGPAALNDSAPPIIEFTRRILEELERFPLPTAQVLAQQLTPKGLHIFKTPDRITHIGVARPRYLDLEKTSVSDPLLAMLRYLAEHADTPRAEQWKSLVALRPEPDAEAAVSRDLRWLIQEGYVIDFVKTGLSVVPKPARADPAPGR